MAGLKLFKKKENHFFKKMKRKRNQDYHTSNQMGAYNQVQEYNSLKSTSKRYAKAIGKYFLIPALWEVAGGAAVGGLVGTGVYYGGKEALKSVLKPTVKTIANKVADVAIDTYVDEDYRQRTHYLKDAINFVGDFL
jgi:hypothetical protein